MSTTTKKFPVISEADGLVLDTVAIYPEGEPKAIVQMAHGMAEHKERYLPFMEFLAEHGFLCVMNDHRGHGKSVKSEEDWGYFYENGGPALVEDMHQITRMLKNLKPGIPLFLFGHSMGSLAVRAYTRKYDKDIDGLIVCGSPSDNSAKGFAVGLVNLLSIFQGPRARVHMVTNMMNGPFEKPFLADGIKNAWICSDRAVVEKYNADPGCGFEFTLNGYKALLYLMQETYAPSGWAMAKPDLPIRFVSGALDPCRTNDAAFASSVELMKKLGYQNVTSRLFTGMRHEILNEKEHQIAYDDILSTLESWMA